MFINESNLIEVVSRNRRGGVFSGLLSVKGLTIVTLVFLLGKATAGRGGDDDSDHQGDDDGRSCICGDGVIGKGEECDDGNTKNGDG